MSDFAQKTWANRVSEYPYRRLLTDEDGGETLVTIARSEGEVSTVGDQFSAENMNDMEERIADAVNTKVNTEDVISDYETATTATVTGTVPDCTVLTEMKASFQDGCDVIAAALTEVGIDTAAGSTPEEIAAAILELANLSDDYDITELLAEATPGTATAADILEDLTAWVNGEQLVGTMPDCSEPHTGHWLNCGEKYTIPEGYHEGTAYVFANYLSKQTVGTATASDIVEGLTAWVNGDQLTGTLVVDTSSSNAPGETYDGVNLFDHDGTCLFVYTWDEVAALTALPTITTWTTDEGIEMTFQGWNWTLAELQAWPSGGRVDVSAVYAPADGATHLIMLIPPCATVSMIFSGTSNTDITVDWGDGTSTDLTSDSTDIDTLNYYTVFSHEYSHDATAIIDIAISGSYSMYGPGFFGQDDTSVDKTAFTALMLRKFYGSDTFRGFGSQYTLSECVNLEEATFAELSSSGSTSFAAYSFYGCSALKNIILPHSTSYIYASCFSGVGADRLILPGGLVTLAGSAWASMPHLNHITIPASVETLGTISSAYSLQYFNMAAGAALANFNPATYTYSLTTVNGLYMSRSGTSVTTSNKNYGNFSYSYNLKYITNVQGISCTVSFGVCTELTYDSLLNIINGLEETSSTLYLYLSDESYALLSEDDIAIATDKGWTVSTV